MLGQYWWTRAIHLAPTSAVVPFQYLSLIWAMIFGFARLGRRADRSDLIFGSAIVVGSGLFLLWHESRPKPNRRPEMIGAALNDPWPGVRNRSCSKQWPDGEPGHEVRHVAESARREAVEQARRRRCFSKSAWVQPPPGPRDGCDEFHDSIGGRVVQADLAVVMPDHGRAVGAAGPVAAGAVVARREGGAVGLRAGEDVVAVRRIAAAGDDVALLARAQFSLFSLLFGAVQVGDARSATTVPLAFCQGPGPMRSLALTALAPGC